MTFEQIIQGCKEGNRKCQDALVHKTAPALMAICMRYLNDQGMAKDALQETYISAFKYLHTYNFEGSFEGWIKKITVRTLLKQLHRIKNWEMPSDHLEVLHYQTQIPDFYQQMDCEALMKLISTLPPSLLAVFNLYVIDGYQHHEIASILGITESTSRAALYKARVKLIEKLNQKEPKLFQWVAVL
jgi:RNA polymerase sigma-70 factor (ECF subfamily)